MMKLKYWIYLKLGVIRRRYSSELEILKEINNMDLSKKQKDKITKIVKESLDRQFSIVSI